MCDECREVITPALNKASEGGGDVVVFGEDNKKRFMLTFFLNDRMIKVGSDGYWVTSEQQLIGEN